jgi:large subunit ribosomal protein L13
LAVSRAWHHLSAREAILGKLSVKVALLLMGKTKPIYDPSQDIGDYVVVTNARHIKVTGKKSQQKMYRHHTMFPGGLKEITYQEMLDRKPEEVRSTHTHTYSLFSHCY